jgi:hypothetical protein
LSSSILVCSPLTQEAAVQNLSFAKRGLGGISSRPGRRASPDELHSNLADSRGIRACYKPKNGAVNVPAGTSELGMIEGVEELCPELQALRFCQLEVFD